MSQIDVPGHGVVEFPDAMTDDQIVAAIKRNFMVPSRQAASFSDTPAGAATYSPTQMRRTMGMEKQGDTMGTIRHAVDSAGYNAGGAVTDMTGSPGLGLAANVAVDAIPAVLGGEAFKLAAAPKMVAAGRDLMQSALKPGKAALKKGDAERAITTLLEEGVNVTEGGLAKLNAKIDKLDDALEGAIQGSTGTVNKIDALRPLKDVLADYRLGTMAADSLPQIRNVAKQFLEHPLLRGSDEIPVQLAQSMKRQNYRELGDKAYGLGLKPAAERDALKGVTTGLREGIERSVPEAGAINAEMGPLVNARNLAQDRVLMSGNKNPLSFGTLFDLERLPAWLADRSELAKSLMARGMYSGNRAIPGAVGGAAGGIPGILMGQQPTGILSGQK